MPHTPEIIDRGRGPQLAGSRITVLDLVQHFRAGLSYEEIRDIMPSLTDADIAHIEAYYRADQANWDRHDDEAVAWREEQIRKQHERFPPEDRAVVLARLQAWLEKKKAERNGAPHSR